MWKRNKKKGWGREEKTNKKKKPIHKLHVQKSKVRSQKPKACEKKRVRRENKEAYKKPDGQDQFRNIWSPLCFVLIYTYSYQNLSSDDSTCPMWAPQFLPLQVRWKHVPCLSPHSSRSSPTIFAFPRPFHDSSCISLKLPLP